MIFKPRKPAELNVLVDRAFFDGWLAMVAEPMAGIPKPHTRDTGAMASLVCQMAVMALLQERGKMPADQEVAADFAIEFVARVWPMMVFDGPLEKLPRFEPWTAESSIFHNLRAAHGRQMLLPSLREVLDPFPSLSASDRSELVNRCPVATACTDGLFTAEEIRTAEYIAAPVVLGYLDRQMEMCLKRDGVAVEPATQEAFQGIPEEACPHLREEAGAIRDGLLAHRRFPVPPAANHSDDFARLSGMRGGAMEGCLRTALYPSSYEAARRLLLSDSFLTLVTERDALTRDRTGFKFWPDLRIPRTLASERALVEALKIYYTSVFPQFSIREVAGIIVRTPLIIFLECARPRMI